jgi:hypothetical protein
MDPELMKDRRATALQRALYRVESVLVLGRWQLVALSVVAVIYIFICAAIFSQGRTLTLVPDLAR